MLRIKISSKNLILYGKNCFTTTLLLIIVCVISYNTSPNMLVRIEHPKIRRLQPMQNPLFPYIVIIIQSTHSSLAHIMRAIFPSASATRRCSCAPNLSSTKKVFVCSASEKGGEDASYMMYPIS